MNSIICIRLVTIVICSSVVLSLVPSLPNLHGRPGAVKKSTISSKLFPSSNGSYCNGENTSIKLPAFNINHAQSKRRMFLIHLNLILTTTTSLVSNVQSANANVKLLDKPPPNPLNLKGTLWETGQLYEKSTSSIDSEEDFIAVLGTTLEALHSRTLLGAIEEGNFGQASRLLRGNLISESQIRLSANALIDLLPEENDQAIYRSSESFRVFLRYLDVLDAEVEAASRPVALGGSGEDNRIRILERLGMCEDALKVFLINVKGGLGMQGEVGK